MFVFGVLSLAPCYSGKFERQVRRADQALYPIQSGSFVGRGPWLYATSPCIKFNLDLERERTKEEKEREEVLHLFRCYTHTHVMLRSGIFFCTCTHTHVILRSGIFSCTFTRTSCYVLAQPVEYKWHHRHLHAITWNFLSRCRNLMCQIIHETQWKTFFCHPKVSFRRCHLQHWNEWMIC